MPLVPLADSSVQFLHSRKYEPVFICVPVIRDLRVIQEHVGRLTVEVSERLSLHHLLLLVFLPCLSPVVNH